MAEIQLFENQNIEKIIFKVVQMKFLAMHITNKKISFYIFTVRNVQNIIMEHDLNILMIFGIKKIYNFDPYNVFLAIDINIPQRLNTAFVLQGHIYVCDPCIFIMYINIHTHTAYNLKIITHTHIYIYIYIYIYIHACVCIYKDIINKHSTNI